MLPSKLQWGFTSATLMPESSSCCPRWRCRPSPSTPPDLPNPHARAWVHPVEDEGALCLHRIRTSADPPAAILHDATALRVRSIALSRRSEEHTSELQSLMRISYAVFCLKKKK